MEWVTASNPIMNRLPSNSRTSVSYKALKPNKLWLRLSLGLLVITFVVILVVALVVWLSVETSFSQYVNISNKSRFGVDLVGTLEAYYLDHGTWEGAEMLLPLRERGERISSSSTGNGEGAASEGRGFQIFLADAKGRITAASQSNWVGKNLTEIGPNRTVLLYGASGVIGFLGEQTPGTVALIEAEQQFAQGITTGLLLTAVAGGVLVFGLGIGLSYSLTRPLRDLTEQIDRWHPGVRSPIQIKGTDEVRRLGTVFNDLAARLAAGEAQRQRLTADVAHELRTPVTVMRGHLEAMMDGVYPLDTAHLGVAYDQVLHLARLVEDLRLLTLAEADRLPLKRVSTSIVPLLKQILERFQPLFQDSGIRVASVLPDGLNPVYVDPHRLQQVFDNLLSNALNHTPVEGRVEIKVEEDKTGLVISIYNDSANPLDEEQVQHLFDRFWRGTESRERDSGGSGLGLTITRELLRLHGGSIKAERSQQGLCFTFTLPHTLDSAPIV